MSATYNFTIQFSTHAEMTQHHEEYARFLAWRSARGHARHRPPGPARGRDSRPGAPDARARPDAALPHSISFSGLPACRNGRLRRCR